MGTAKNSNPRTAESTAGGHDVGPNPHVRARRALTGALGQDTAAERTGAHLGRETRQNRGRPIHGGAPQGIAASPTPRGATNPLLRRIQQTYLASAGALGDIIDEFACTNTNPARAHQVSFVATLLTSAVAPANFCRPTPAVLAPGSDGSGLPPAAVRGPDSNPSKFEHRCDRVIRPLPGCLILFHVGYERQICNVRHDMVVVMNLAPDPQATDRGVCRFPGCTRPVRASAGSGRQAAYCEQADGDGPVHNSANAWKERQRLAARGTAAPAGGSAGEAVGNPVSMARLGLEAQLAELPARFDALARLLTQVQANVEVLGDREAIAAEVEQAHADALARTADADRLRHLAEARARAARPTRPRPTPPLRRRPRTRTPRRRRLPSRVRRPTAPGRRPRTMPPLRSSAPTPRTPRSPRCAPNSTSCGCMPARKRGGRGRRPARTPTSASPR